MSSDRWADCLTVTRGLIVTQPATAAVVADPTGYFDLRVFLTGADPETYATMTARLSKQPYPRNWLAIMIGDPPDGELLGAPAVTTAIDRQIDLFGGARARAYQLLNQITGQMPLEDASADFVICAWGMLNYAEARRILRPGGFLAHMACVTRIAMQGADSSTRTRLSRPPQSRRSTRTVRPRQSTRRRRTNTKRTRNPDEDPRLQLHRRLRRPRRSSSSPRAPLRAQSKQYLTVNQKATLAWRLRIYYGTVS